MPKLGTQQDSPTLICPHVSAFEKDPRSGFGVIDRVSDQRREPIANGEEEAASEAALRDGSDRRTMT